ncbi:MAG: AI-2E family transporter [Candidatus Diapherotrites archaeon]|nr:AI-2E family transporter [Candidatus Diapherotrites archaeon]
MISGDKLQLKGYLFWAIVLGIIVLASLIMLPFVIAILSAYVLAYMARPLYLKLVDKLGSNLAAVTCVLVAIVLVVVPITLVVVGAINEAGDAISNRNISHYITLIAINPMFRGFNLNAVTMQTQFNQIVSDMTASILASLPNLIIGLFITLIGMYYALCKWDKLSAELRKYIPSSHKEHIIYELNLNTQAILYGTLVMAILEFVISFVGFTFLGVELSLIMAALIFVLAFLPSIGPIMVWAPLAIFYAVNQQYEIAVGVAIIGVILTFGVETILYAKWIGDRTRIHPYVMIVGVIGGISLFGVFGFIFGPIILASAIGIVKGAMRPNG